MIQTILSLVKAGLSIWDKKLAVKYQKQLYDLQVERDKILQGADKYENKIDRNLLDRNSRDIELLGNLVAAEISRSKSSSL